MPRSESELMQQLSNCVRAPFVNDILIGVAAELEWQLANTNPEKSAHRPLSLDIFGPGLPAGILSGWIFVLREGISFPAERHANSVQRMFALIGPGAMETWTGNEWHRHNLNATEQGIGLSIPANTWHRPVPSDRPWPVASFHTVLAEDLVEELGDPLSSTTYSSRHYVSG